MSTTTDPVLWLREVVGVRGYGADMKEPVASRPYMPGYGTLPPDQGTGLLPWSWAAEQLTTSRNYWLATVGTDGQPHAMPVWGAWMGDALWFSCGLRSRKMRNLRAQPRCSVSTQDPEQPVMLQGTAEVIPDRERIATFLAATLVVLGLLATKTARPETVVRHFHPRQRVLLAHQQAKLRTIATIAERVWG